MTRVQVINEVSVKPYQGMNWELCFQWCRYIHDKGKMDLGYRFIWRNDGKLMAHRGQARIVSIKQLLKLAKMAQDAGWGDYDGDAMTNAVVAQMTA